MIDFWLAVAAIWLVSGLLELSAGRRPIGWAGRLAANLGLFFSSASVGGLLALNFNLLGVLFLILALYRSVNLFRILAARLEKHNLKRVSVRSSSILLAGQLVILLADYFWPAALSAQIWLALLAASQLVVAATFITSFSRQLAQTKFQPSKRHLSQKELPTLTVAIPAKNETSDLEDCLASLLANDYPKLEILVLDDSAGSKTGEIIRALAHDGVRFILGEPPSGRWLAKNLAYDRLSSEANGELIMFCGVDVRFAPGSLRWIVESMIDQHRQMISLMPLNQTQYRSLVVQPMRYFWELARPRFGTSQPVLSTCWVIWRKQLAAAGSFKSVASEVVPERHFASFCSAQAGSYSFIRSDQTLGLSSVKSPPEQRATAVRTRYPLLRKRLASAAGTSLFSLTWLITPFALIVILPFYGFSLFAEAACIAASLAWLGIYGVIMRLAFRANWASAAFFLPAVVIDIALVNYSLLKYEFGRVVWKGRDAARPVMGLQNRSSSAK